MSTEEKLNGDINGSQVNDDLTPVDTNEQAPIDSPEITAPPAPPTPPIDIDPLEGFNIDDYKDGVEGDERYRILGLYVGYLAGTDLKVDPIKLRHAVVKWDERNRPPLGVMEIHAHIKANLDKWLRHHYLHKTGTWAFMRHKKA